MDHRTYVSPFSWRYGRAELRSLFSEVTRRKLWRAVWVALAQAQSEQGLVSAEEVADLRAHASEVDIDAALAIEREIHHDLMAEIRVFASQAKRGGGKLHLGATSMKPTPEHRGPACKVSTKDCASCHMPKYELADFHYEFTDHDIRVVRPGVPYPE